MAQLWCWSSFDDHLQSILNLCKTQPALCSPTRSPHVQISPQTDQRGQSSVGGWGQRGGAGRYSGRRLVSPLTAALQQQLSRLGLVWRKPEGRWHNRAFKRCRRKFSETNLQSSVLYLGSPMCEIFQEAPPCTAILILGHCRAGFLAKRKLTSEEDHFSICISWIWELFKREENYITFIIPQVYTFINAFLATKLSLYQHKNHKIKLYFTE